MFAPLSRVLASLSRYRLLLFWGETLGYFSLHIWMTSYRSAGEQPTYIAGLLFLLSFMLLMGLIGMFPDDWTIGKQRVVIGLISSVAFLTSFALRFPGSHIASQEALPHIWHYVLLPFFHLATIWVLIVVVSEYQFPLKRILLYTLNPLILNWFAGKNALIILAVFFLCLGLLCFKKEWFFWGWLAFGCVILCQPLAALIVPFWLTSKNWKASLLPIGGSLFFWLFLGETAGVRVLNPFFSAGAEQSVTNIGTMFFHILPEHVGLISTLGLFGICLFLIFLGVHNSLRSTFLVVGCAAFLFMFWPSGYLVWLAMFLVFYPSRAWLYVHIVVGLMFLMGTNAPHNFTDVLLVLGVIYLPFLGISLWDIFHHQHIFQSRVFAPVHTISVIIPTLNEARNLERCLQAYRHNQRVRETLVVDGGSTDATETIAREMKARFLRSPKGRGRQIKTGIAQASGDVVVILHADCLIEQDLPERLVRFLNEHPDHIGGAVGMAYANQSMANRVIACLNNCRAQLAGIAFGDQVQFFRKEALPLIGGYPNMMLMEDIELSMRLKEHGSVGFLPQGVKVSKRRWQKHGILNNVKKVLWLSGSYLVQRRLKVGDLEGHDFYERYYHA
jgi:rSAM/selenodomain-associated transferase 2